jgi:release factor glutamine methyltransferase
MTYRSAGARSAVARRLRAAGCVFAEQEAGLLLRQATTAEELEAMVDRRVAGVPLEHVLGWAEFCGLRIAVEPGVFVPRRRTEFLVRRAVLVLRRRAALAPEAGWAPAVVDLCCGSGAVGAALVAALGPIELYAVDSEPAAVRCARRNLAATGARVFEGDLYAPLPPGLRGRVDLVVANAPYVPSGAVALLPPEARDHEPLAALDGGEDGLDVLRRVIAAAPAWLVAGGHVLVETSERQAQHLATALRVRGLVPRVVRSATLNATVVVGTRR